jgi:hypothetical protein
VHRNRHDRCQLYVDGADEPAPAGGALIVLDFGAPCYDPTTFVYGSELFTITSCTTDDQLLPLARANGRLDKFCTDKRPDTSANLSKPTFGSELSCPQLVASRRAVLWHPIFRRYLSARTSIAGISFSGIASRYCERIVEMRSLPALMSLSIPATT